MSDIPRNDRSIFGGQDTSWAFTDEAEEVSASIDEALAPIFRRALALGVNPREVDYLVGLVSGNLASHACLRHGADRRKAGRQVPGDAAPTQYEEPRLPGATYAE